MRTIRKVPKKPLECRSCHWVWIPRGDGNPDRCPNCHCTAYNSEYRGRPKNPDFAGRYESERGARKGRNPQTGETIKIAASKRLKFEPARAMKTALNAKRRATKKKAPARVTPRPVHVRSMRQNGKSGSDPGWGRRYSAA